MTLRQSQINPRIIEDELCNPIFQHVGLHLGDVEQFVKERRELQNQVDLLQRRNDELYNELQILKR